MATLRTPFGEFKGKKKNGIVQYLGIKYASLKDQLAIPEMVKEYGNKVIDATEFGQRPPGTDYCKWEQDVLVQQGIDTPTAPPMSGTDCLNLNIMVPDIQINTALPVMAYIHGGGYIMGANWWPQKDPGRLVSLSVETGSPVIVVNLNYRLGLLGNLTSEELRNAGYLGNNGLRDQSCALEWIKAHIDAFGGDPDNITVFGESAGAASVLSQLYSKEPLFKRAISMSGTPLLLKALDVPTAEGAYSALMKDLELENASTEERVTRLLTISAEELTAKTPMYFTLKPFVDNDIVPDFATFEGVANASIPIPGREWCSELMIGDTQHDGSVFALMGLNARKEGLAAAFATSLEKNLASSTAAKAILNVYGIDTSTPDDDTVKLVIDFATDIGYYIPAFTYAQSWPGKAYRYHFNEPNPWEGPFKGYATHGLDIFYLFQNYNEKLSPEAREVAIALAKDFIDFASGKVTGPEYDRESGTVRTFGPSGTSTSGVEKNNGWGNTRRDALIKLGQDGVVDLDELSVAWDKFLAGQ